MPIPTMVVLKLVDLGCLSLEYIPFTQHYRIATLEFMFLTLHLQSLYLFQIVQVGYSQ